jgi:hypothetical protein
MQWMLLEATGNYCGFVAASRNFPWVAASSRAMRQKEPPSAPMPTRGPLPFWLRMRLVLRKLNMEVGRGMVGKEKHNLDSIDNRNDRHGISQIDHQPRRVLDAFRRGMANAKKNRAVVPR